MGIYQRLARTRKARSINCAPILAEWRELQDHGWRS